MRNENLVIWLEGSYLYSIIKNKFKNMVNVISFRESAHQIPTTQFWFNEIYQFDCVDEAQVLNIRVWAAEHGVAEKVVFKMPTMDGLEIGMDKYGDLLDFPPGWLDHSAQCLIKLSGLYTGRIPKKYEI